jgi:hypothetical protein
VGHVDANGSDNLDPFIRGSWESIADPALPPQRREVGDNTHSVAIIDACRPWNWRDQFAETNTPSPEVTRKAQEKFVGYLKACRKVLNRENSNAVSARRDLSQFCPSINADTVATRKKAGLSQYDVAKCLRTP